DKTEALFYVQAPHKIDLPGDMSYQFHWLSMLQQVEGTLGPNELLPMNRAWLKAVKEDSPALLQRGAELGFAFTPGQPLQPGKVGRLPTTLEWAKRLTAADIRVLTGESPFSEPLPDPDWGFTRTDLQDPAKAPAIYRVIQRRLDTYSKERPRGYLV